MVENEELLEIGGVSQAPYSVTSGHGMTSGTTVEMCGASARSVAVDRQYWRGVGPTNGLAAVGSMLPAGCGEVAEYPPSDAASTGTISLIRVRGQCPKGGYDVGHGHHTTVETAPTELYAGV
jgi:hypothetical protein